MSKKPKKDPDINTFLARIVIVVVLAVLGVMALLYFAVVAEGGGSGSWPYSGPGNWVIGTETHVWDEDIEVDGHLLVSGAGPLYLTRCNLTMIGSYRDIQLYDDFHVSWTNISGESDVEWLVFGGQVYFNDSSVSNVLDSISEYHAGFSAWNTTFNGSDTWNYGLMSSGNNVTITGCTFTNMTKYGVFIGTTSTNVTVTNNTFLSCLAGITMQEATGTFTPNFYHHYLNITLLDTLRNPVNAADVYLYDGSDTLFDSFSTDALGKVEWSIVNETQNPITIVCDKNRNYAETTVNIENDVNITIIMQEYAQESQIAVVMVNDYTKEVIPFGTLLCYLNSPDGEQDDDYLVFDWDNYVYYPTDHYHVVVYDHFGRLVWEENTTVDYSEERVEVVAYIDFVRIVIKQYDVDTEEILDPPLITEWKLQLDGDESITYYFDGDEVGVPRMETLSNDYTILWDTDENVTSGSAPVENVSADNEGSGSVSTGYMIANVGVKLKGVQAGGEEWYAWIPGAEWLTSGLRRIATNPDWAGLLVILTILSAYMIYSGRAVQKGFERMKQKGKEVSSK